jgi:VanZ family protein
MYANGCLARTFPDFRLGTDFTGRLVIGTSPVRTDGWLGRIKGLAIYDQELSSEGVRKHFESWTARGTPESGTSEHLKALYLFNEGTGSTIHNEAQKGLNLYVPKRFSLLHQPFLKPFWEEYSPDWDYLRDISMNVVGFVPLGFVLFAYWTLGRPIKSATIATVAVGLAVSITIEVLQWYLPTRNSGTTDLFTNTLGTFLGSQIHRIPVVASFFSQLPE